MEDIVEAVTKQIIKDELVLPTLPDSVVRIIAELDNDDLEIEYVEKLIAQDQTIAVRLIKYASSAYMGRATKSKSLKQAIIRIGLTALRSTVIAIGIEQVFNSGDSKAHYYLKKQWQQNLEVMATALAILQHSKHTTAFPQETILLLSLCHSIGIVPVIASLAQRGPMHLPLLTALESTAVRDLSVHIVSTWGFENKFARYISDLEYGSTKQIKPTDFIIAAYSVILEDEAYSEIFSNRLLEDGSILDPFITETRDQILSSFQTGN